MPQSVDDILSELKRADDAYHNTGTPIMSDAEYDALASAAGYSSIGAPVKGAKHDLPIPLPSLEQIQKDNFSSWMHSNGLRMEDLVATAKIDGISALLVYQDSKLYKAYTRGDGLQGKDITEHVRALNLPAPELDCMIRGELVMHVKDFETFNEDYAYKNPRNTVAGIFNRDSITPEAVPYITFYAYQLIPPFFGDPTVLSKESELMTLQLFGFNTPLSYTLIDVSAKHKEPAPACEELISRWKQLPYEIDGVVVYVNDRAKALEMDDSVQPGDNPKSAIKFKVSDALNSAITEVASVEWNLSKHGYYKPTILINPVELVGVTITKCTGFNAAFIRDNKIGPGAKIEITRSGDVIPFCRTVISPSANVALPQNAHWSENDVDLIINANMSQEDERDIQIAIMTDFFKKAKVDAIGEGIAARLYDSGLTSVEKAINAPARTLCSAVGSDVIGMTLFGNIQTVRTELDFPTICGAAGFIFGRGLGVRKFESLFNEYSGDDPFTISLDDIITIPGFDFKTAQKIVDGMPVMKQFLEDIRYEVEWTPRNPSTQSGSSASSGSGSLKGVNFVFTGFRDPSLERQIRALGGDVKASMSSKVHYVVAANTSKSSTKIDKAKQLGARIISILELKKMISNA